MPCTHSPGLRSSPMRLMKPGDTTGTVCCHSPLRWLSVRIGCGLWNGSNGRVLGGVGLVGEEADDRVAVCWSRTRLSV